MAAGVSYLGNGGLRPKFDRARQRIDVQDYAIDGALIDPNAQTITAVALVRFHSFMDDASGRHIRAERCADLEAGHRRPGSPAAGLNGCSRTMSVRVTFGQPLPKGKPATMIFTPWRQADSVRRNRLYSALSSPSITPDITYLMYPARWFPVNDYTADRFTMDLKVTTPCGGIRSWRAASIRPIRLPAGAASTQATDSSEAAFPGSLAVVRGEPKQIASGGVTTALYFRKKADMAGAYGEEFGRAMTELTPRFSGCLPRKISPWSRQRRVLPMATLRQDSYFLRPTRLERR